MGDPLEEYLGTYDDAAGGMFVQLDAAIRQAAPEQDGAIKYRLLSYTVDRDRRHWVCPVNATKSTLMTWDMPRDSEVDTAAEMGYVPIALATRNHFLANAEEISAEARARTRTR